MNTISFASISANLVVLLITVFIASFPVLILLWYFNYRDKGEKEPRRLRQKVFRWGIAVTFFAAAIEGAVDYAVFDISGGSPPFIYFLLMPFLVVALTEESLKFWLVKEFAFKHEKFNEVLDGITYCIIASMGFAILENILYTVQYGWGTGFLRAFTAVPAHALFSGIMGHYMGIAKFTPDKKRAKRLLRKGLMAGIFFHGLYNFLLMSGVPALIFMVFPLLAYMAVILNHAIRMANKGDMSTIKFF